MDVYFSAKAKHSSHVRLFCNDKFIVGAGGQGFTFFNVHIDAQPKNTLIVEWNCDTVVDTHLIIEKICINDQKLNINKSWYLPYDKPPGHTEYQTLHGGHLVWPGRLKLNFLVTNKREAYMAIRRENMSSHMMKLYSVIYD